MKLSIYLRRKHVDFLYALYCARVFLFPKRGRISKNEFPPASMLVKCTTVGGAKKIIFYDKREERFKILMRRLDHKSGKYSHDLMVKTVSPSHIVYWKEIPMRKTEAQ